jgi:hypothetical protein
MFRCIVNFVKIKRLVLLVCLVVGARSRQAVQYSEAHGFSVEYI